MSDSYAVMPLVAEVREWLESDGHPVPERDGRAISLAELKATVSSLKDVQADWKNEGLFRDGYLKSTDGRETEIIVGKPGDAGQPCEFHFRGGDVELIFQVVRAIAVHAGPHVVYAHSGSFTQVVG